MCSAVLRVTRCRCCGKRERETDKRGRNRHTYRQTKDRTAAADIKKHIDWQTDRERQKQTQNPYRQAKNRKIDNEKKHWLAESRQGKIDKKRRCIET